MTKIACLLLRIYVRRENTKTGIQLCFNLVFTTASQKSHLNRIIICFSLVSYCMDVSELSCFHHEWGLHPSYVKDNGGKVGDNVGGKVGGKVGGDVVENIVGNIVENIIDVPSFVPSFVPS